MHPSTAALTEPAVHSQVAECIGASAKPAVIPKALGRAGGEKRCRICGETRVTQRS